MKDSRGLDRPAKAATGIAGLDDVLIGGFSRGDVFLLEGTPGTGKTTIALQFLQTGAAAGERGIYISLSESERELRDTVASHGWVLEPGVELFELSPPENLFDDNQRQSLLYSSDLELGETVKLMFETIERVNPRRIVLDSLAELRLLSQDSLRYRRQILALKHFFARTGATALLIDDLTAEAPDRAVHSVVHGVVALEELAPVYGAERRRLRVIKYRGQSYRGGYHDFAIRNGGVEVFPRLIAAEHRSGFARRQLSSGIASLDALLGGGVERGSSTLLIGPAGTGKSIITLQFLRAAAARGERVAMFVFDEELSLLLDRARALGFDLRGMRERGELVLEQVDAAELSPGEFAHRVRHAVHDSKAATVVIDSLNGYQAAMPEEGALILHMHELVQYLNRQGASTFVTVAQSGLVGDMRSPVDITFLADTVILLRYFEAAGRVRRALSVIKKRASTHEDTIREFSISQHGISIGEPLEAFQGVLTGVPQYVGTASPLLDQA